MVFTEILGGFCEKVDSKDVKFAKIFDLTPCSSSWGYPEILTLKRESLASLNFPALRQEKTFRAVESGASDA